MAAQEYFMQHPPAQAGGTSPFLAPGPAPQRASSQPPAAPYQQYSPYLHPNPNTPPQNYFGAAPPPYQDPLQKPQVHFAQSPRPQQPRPEQRNSFSHPQRPSPLHQQQMPQPPNNIPPFAPQVPAPWQNQPYQPNTRPYGGANPSQASFGSSGYSSDPEEHRRRHKHRRHHSDDVSTRTDGSHRRDRKVSDTSRGGTTEGLIGATGGGLIGDLIFPGLGTVGGALAGWIGGKEFSKHSKQREEKRALEQEKWERRYGSRNLSPGDFDNDRDRSRSRDSRRRRRSHE